MKSQQIKKFADGLWDESIIPELFEYIRIPCKSPMFDPKWQTNGYLNQAIQLLAEWAKQHPAKNMQLKVLQIENRTPLLYIEIPGQISETILLYGHMDKQPEMIGWNEDLGPWQPVLRDNKLYGRGGADDGYAMFASLTAILALQEQNIPHARCVIIIEACEESGSYDLPFYIDELKNEIGNPSLVICLDSGCGNYQQLWSTTSLRGTITGDLTVAILKEGVHSGNASGAVADSFRIMRQILSRVEDETTGEIKLTECQTTIPPQRIQQTKLAAQALGQEAYRCFPFVEGATPTDMSPEKVLLSKTWAPTLTVTGIDGLPGTQNAGNVLRAFTRAKLSFRIPPTCDLTAARQAIKKTLEADPPYHAQVSFKLDKDGPGWNAPEVAPWLHQASADASKLFFGKEIMYMGEGGSIPFMGMLGEKFPQAQFLITGVLGPHSNAHGPNEFLHIPTAKNLTCCVAHVIAEHYQQFKKN